MKPALLACVPLALLAMPATADPLQEAQSRCIMNMQNENTLICAAPAGEMTFAEFVSRTSRLSVEEVLELNQLPVGSIDPDENMPMVYIAVGTKE